MSFFDEPEWAQSSTYTEAKVPTLDEMLEAADKMNRIAVQAHMHLAMMFGIWPGDVGSVEIVRLPLVDKPFMIRKPPDPLNYYPPLPVSPLLPDIQPQPKQQERPWAWVLVLPESVPEVIG